LKTETKKYSTVRRSISKKIILTGSYCVGKTSLISRFVYQRFPFSYQTTLGVRIDKKVVLTDDINLNMIIWDIGGEQNQQRIPVSYYLGSSGVIYVFDVSRPSSFLNIANDVDYIKQKLPKAPIVIVGNKIDLLEPAHLEQVKNTLPIPAHFYTSAREGDNVEDVFSKLAQDIIHGSK